MLPLKDDNPTRRFPILTLGLIVVNALVFLYQRTRPDDGSNLVDSAQAIVCRFGVVPDALLNSAQSAATNACVFVNNAESPILSLFTSQFLHGSWLHLGGNMLFLWVFGNNIEDRLGRLRFLPFYLICGALAGLTQAAFDVGSTVPLIGASGAIAGVLGAYILLYPKARVWTLILWIPLKVPAWFVLGLWMAFQFAYAAQASAVGGEVAYLAHLGGFFAGLLLIRPALLGRPNAPPGGPSDRPRLETLG